MRFVPAFVLAVLLQVALNWIICKGALPIPGAKHKRQVEEIAGAVGWRLSEGEVLELERAADKIAAPLGAPFENW
jgi:diketogulonate reductase-like aldo/keto reductase